MTIAVSLKHLETDFLKKIWDMVGKSDGIYDTFVVKECISVNGYHIDDIYAELVQRGEDKHVEF